MSFENQNRENSEYGPDIRIPDDENLLNSLTNKLAEYEERLNNNPHISDIYKHKVLKKLLDEGSVRPVNFYGELVREGENIDGYEFEEACAVIRNYVENEGRGNLGGTGLSGYENTGNGDEGKVESVVSYDRKPLTLENVTYYAKTFQEIRVKRSSGAFETGWYIEGTLDNGVTVHVVKRNNNNEITGQKKASIEELMKWNNPT
jgi:hypothetical protein